MSKKSLSERDICTKHITPPIVGAGWPARDVWSYEHPYPPGYKSYSKATPIRVEEFAPEKAWWENREESEFAWRVPVEAIKANNDNLDIKNPNKADEDHGDPLELLARYKQLMVEVAETREALKHELMAALDGKG